VVLAYNFGTTVNLDTNLNGSGDIDAGNLKATNANNCIWLRRTPPVL
jgi:hypothetical protein